MTKYGLPIATVRWADCDSRTSIYGCRHFVEGEDVMSCRWGAPALLFPPRPPPSHDGRPKWDCVFQMSQRFENGERVMIKVERRSKWQHSVFRSDSAVSNWNGFSQYFWWGWGGALCCYFPFIFFLSWKKHQGSFVRWVWCLLIAYVVCVWRFLYISGLSLLHTKKK